MQTYKCIPLKFEKKKNNPVYFLERKGCALTCHFCEMYSIISLYSLFSARLMFYQNTLESTFILDQWIVHYLEALVNFRYPN